MELLLLMRLLDNWTSVSPCTYFRFTSVGVKRDAGFSNGEGGVELLLLMRWIIGQHTLSAI